MLQRSNLICIELLSHITQKYCSLKIAIVSAVTLPSRFRTQALPALIVKDMIEDGALGELTDSNMHDGNPKKWPSYDREVTS